MKGIDELLKRFPGYHIEIQLYPSGGMVEATGCEVCGVDDGRYETVSWKTNKGKINTFEDAVNELHSKLTKFYGDSAFAKYKGE